MDRVARAALKPAREQLAGSPADEKARPAASLADEVASLPDDPDEQVKLAVKLAHDRVSLARPAPAAVALARVEAEHAVAVPQALAAIRPTATNAAVPVAVSRTHRDGHHALIHRPIDSVPRPLRRAPQTLGLVGHGVTRRRWLAAQIGDQPRHRTGGSRLARRAPADRARRRVDPQVVQRASQEAHR
jgi:hypothetical protein